MQFVSNSVKFVSRYISSFDLKKSGILLIIISFMMFFGYVIHSIDYEVLTKWVKFTSHADAQWYRGVWGYFLGGIVFSTIAGPRQALAFFGAYFFGFWQGLFASTGAVICGCYLDALIGRLFETRVRNLLKGRLNLAFGFWREHPFTVSMILRLLPVGSNFLNNLAAGATGVPLKCFVLGSSVGYIPQMVVFSLLGTGVELNSAWKSAMAVALFGVLTIFGGWVYKQYQSKLQS